MIYLDNAATTEVFDEVINVINLSLREDYFNPSALYFQADQVHKKIENARQNVAEFLGCSPKEVVFTSGATEANNWAIFNAIKRQKCNVVTSLGEHSSVHECFTVQKNRGLEVRFSTLNSNGSVNIEKLLELVDENTALISIIHRSNETGICNDIFKISSLAKSKNPSLIFHSDGVQEFGKSRLNLSNSNVDLYSISGHKIGASKGVGAIYINKKLSIKPYIFGGGQEGTLRSGTENVHGILGFSRACSLYFERYNVERIASLNKIFVDKIVSELSEVVINTCDKSSNIISVSFDGVNAEILQRLLTNEGVIIGLGSACAARMKSNRVLFEMKIPQKLIEGSVRISFGIDNTADKVTKAASIIIKKVRAIRDGKLG